ncbi:MAG TPA: hypothetical protein DD636_07290 [Anaerolineaceae bacterium]|nr:hypothetical protein [Anaerolineaceae bacterium]
MKDRSAQIPTNSQQQAADLFDHPSIFFSGPASSGKTNAALLRLQNILTTANQGSALVLVPQRSLAEPYHLLLREMNLSEGERVSIQTMSSLVRRMISLFWPVVSSHQVFKHPYEAPRFLTLETSQYYMAQIVRPMIDQGRFNNVTLPPFRLYSQIIDNLNKSALVGFPHTEIGQRLSSAFIGDASRQNVFKDVQEAVNQFRDYCLANNLVDYSLQVELFCQFLWPNQTFQKYISNQFAHLIYDNAEEDPPYVHDIVSQWLPGLKSALIIHDDQAGYRSFLGADPLSSLTLAKHCQYSLVTTANFVSSAPLQELRNCFQDIRSCQPSQVLIRQTIGFPAKRLRFFPELLEELIVQIGEIRANPGGKDKKIAILAPYVSDSLRFSLTHNLESLGLKVSIQKPSSSLLQDSVIKTLVLLSKFAHPVWKMPVSFLDTAVALTNSIAGLDLNRAHLILGSFDQLNPYLNSLPEPVISERIPSELIERYKVLREWLLSTDSNEPLDSFLSRLFGEVLSQPGFQFEGKVQAGTSTAVLMESFQKFSLSLDQRLHVDQNLASLAFIEAIDSGLISALYLSDWDSQIDYDILIAPVMSYLMRNEPVDYQFWLNIGSKGWYERLEQPLTHPIVLSRNWQEGKQWTADDETAYNQANLQRTLSGLLLRCKEKVFAFTSDYNEVGVEERGQLLTLFQNLFRKAIRSQNER